MYKALFNKFWPALGERYLSVILVSSTMGQVAAAVEEAVKFFQV